MKLDCGCLHPCKDRISDLPEPIRSKVMSFLPMEEAIRTSILSREWRYVSSSLPNLDLDQNEFELKGYDVNQFRNIVDRLLISRARVDVERFKLSVEGDDNLEPLFINAWILFAIHNNVRDFCLTVRLFGINNFKLPCCFFQQFSTLRDLHLEGDLSLEMPPDAIFPRLRRCRLVWITFNDDFLMKNLFCKCPSIEELTLENCYIVGFQNTFTISSPSLKILTLNLEIFSELNTAIMINTTSLQEIDYSCSIQPAMSSETLCSLLRASFASVKTIEHRDRGENSILYGLCNVIRLSLSYSYTETLSRYPSSFKRLESCSSLRHLELAISPTWRHLNVVLNLLKIYSELVTLRIALHIKIKSTNILNDQQINSDKLMLEHLNTVELVDFRGSKEEIYIVRYLLENAIVLEKMTILYSKSQKNNATTRMKVSEELLNVIKASVRATILFK